MNLNDEFKAYAAAWEEKIGAFIQAVPGAGCLAEAPSNAGGSLAGLPFAVKDNIAVKGLSLSCGSKLLEGMTAPYTASAAQRLLDAGALCVGKTNMDEFGMGSSTDASALKKTNNPWDTARVAGGSSGGSAAAVAAGLVPFALGSDTGGSVRQPAAFCGVAGLKPTYGAVSRYGLVAYASSFDTVGVLAKNIGLCRAVFNRIKGADPKDQTSREAPVQGAPEAGESGVIGVLSPETLARALAGGSKALEEAARAAALEPETLAGFEKAKERFAALGYTLRDVDAPALKYGAPAYYTIAAAEASANLARFDGVRYGKRPDWAEHHQELIDKTRAAGFGAEVKLRILLGTFVLRSGFQDRYYLRAQHIRARIRENFETHLGDEVKAGPCAAILMPVFPCRAFGRDADGLDPFAQKAADLYTCCANLAGLPALSFPASLGGGLPVGVQLLGRPFAEERLFSIAARYEEAHPFPRPPGYRDFFP